jgi:hypothetical protein
MKTHRQSKNSQSLGYENELNRMYYEVHMEDGDAETWQLAASILLCIIILTATYRTGKRAVIRYI